MSASLVLPVGLDGATQQLCQIISDRVVDGNRGLDDGVIEQAVKQLFETVQNLCCAVSNLTNNMKHMIETVSQANANPVDRTESEALRLTI